MACVRKRDCNDDDKRGVARGAAPVKFLMTRAAFAKRQTFTVTDGNGRGGH